MYMDRSRRTGLVKNTGTLWKSLSFAIVGGLLLLLPFALGACGSSAGSSFNGVTSESPQKVLDSVTSALKTTKSVRISGSGTQSGKSISFDLVSFKNGDIAGEFTQDGDGVQLRQIGADDYIKADSAFYTSEGIPSSAASLLGGIWISGPTSQFGLGDDFSLTSLASSLNKDNGTLSSGSTGTIDGLAARGIKSSKGGTLWVATSGPAYPVEVKKGGDQAETIKFTAWNSNSTPNAPSGAKPLSSFEAS
jgi:hypothetical protein